MGSQTKYGTKTLVYVTAYIGTPEAEGAAPPTLKYGWFTNIPTKNQQALGQIVIPPDQFADPPQGLVIGCSFPKPYRASLREPLRYTSSFVSKDKIAAAKKAGYRVTPSKVNSRINLSDNSFVKTVYVSMRGVKYGWNIPKVTVTNVKDLSGLGVADAVANDRDELCFGANFPKPPRASITIISGDDIKTISTFYDPSKTLPEGWTPKGAGKGSI